MNAFISADGSYVTVPLTTGACRFHAVWLRDNARDPQTICPDNGQRLITLLEQPQNSRITAATVLDRNRLSVKFQDSEQTYDYPLEWLRDNRYDRAHGQTRGWTNAHVQRWGRELRPHMPTADYSQAVKSRFALGRWLAAVRRYGFAIMTGLPQDPDSLLKVAELFGFVRETNYGRCFDVRSQLNPTNLAYTGRGLQAHTDNPYRDPVPTLQILSCIENTAEGGESVVVDGFNTAEILLRENAQHFALLTEHCARFRYAGSAGVDLSSKRPIIELNPDGELIAIRFNNRSAAPFTDIPFERMPAYYRAYRHFAEILEREENQVLFKLQANELFIVDNTRVMHSRTAFSGGGTRWLRGCYADKDGLLSTLQAIESRHVLQLTPWAV